MTNFTPKKRQLPKSKVTIEALEPRILFSADVLLSAADPFGELPDDGELELLGSSKKFSEARLEYVFIDRSTTDYKILVDDLNRNNSENTTYTLVFIESNENGIEKIAATLATTDRLDAVHIISHGSQGQVNIGNMSLSNTSFEENLVFFEQWCAALKPDADLLFYGCDLTTNESGISLLAKIAAATGADVAASQDLTGSSAKGGDWDLETEIGLIESVTPFSAAMQNDYSELLSASPVIEWALETRVLENGSVPITNSQLHTSDIDNTDTDLNYTVTTNPTNGFIAYASAPWPGAAITNFTQQAINDNEVVYVNTGGNGNDSFAFEVSDGTSTSVIRTMDFIVEPPQTTELSSGIELNTDGGNDAFLQSDILTTQPIQGATIEFVIAASDVPLHVPIVTAHNGVNNHLQIAIDTTTGNLIFGVGTAAPIQSTTMDYRDILDNTPHSAAITWSAVDGSWSIYIDGELKDKGAGLNTGNALDLSASRVELGNDILIAGPDSYVSGNYYDIRLWNYARNNSEIDHLSELKLQDPDPRLLANWQMDNLDTQNKVDDTVFGNKLSAMHHTGSGFTASAVRGDLNVYENSPIGTSLGYVLPHEKGASTTKVIDGDFLRAGTPLTINSYSATQSIGDWNVTAGQVDHFRADGYISDQTLLGGNSVKLVDNSSSIEQTLTTQPGNLYLLTYSVAGDFSASTDPVSLATIIGNQSDTTTITHNIDWSLQNNLQWQHRSLIFATDTPNSTLNFSSIAEGALLADVRVTEIPLEVASVLSSQANMSYDSVTNKFYKRLDQKSTATGAETIAANQTIYGVSSRLVTIHSAYENARVHSLTSDLTDSIWIGANDVTTVEGEWHWNLGNGAAKHFWDGDSSGNVIDWSYENWKNGEPNDYQPNGGEDFGTMDQQGKWNDEPVTTGLNYLFLEWDAATVLSANQLSSVSGSGYSIDPLTGEVKVDSGAILDHETANTETFLATAGYLDGHNDTHDITVSVNNVNEPPVPADSTVTLNEDDNHYFSLADFGISDIESNNIQSVIIRSLPSNGLLTLSSNPTGLNQIVLAADIPSLMFTPAPDANGTNYDNLTFDVVDDGGTDHGGQNMSISAGTINFDVTAINDAPSGTDTNLNALESTDYSFQTSDFGFTDTADNHVLDSVFVSAANGSGTVTYNNNTISAALWVPAADISAGLLKYVPPPLLVGNAVANISFTVRDDGTITTGGVDTAIQSNTIIMNILDVKVPPSGSDKTISLLEDSVYTYTQSDFGFSDSDSDQFLSLIIDSLPASGNLQLNNTAITANQTISVSAINAGLLTYTTAQDSNGISVANFDFTVMDDSGVNDTATAPNTIFIDIVSVNDPPAGADTAITVNEYSSHQFGAADFGFSDTDGNSLAAITINSLPTEGSLLLNGAPVAGGQTINTGSISLLTFDLGSNHGVTNTSFNFQVQDNGGTVQGGIDTALSQNKITLSLTNVNLPPEGTDSTVVVDEDTPHTFNPSDFGFSDIDGNNLLAVQINTMPVSGTLTLSGNPISATQIIPSSQLSNLEYIPAANMNGTNVTSMNFRVVDDGGTANGGANTAQSDNSISFDINPVNDAPSATDKSIVVAEYTNYQFSASDFGFSDVENDGLASVTINTLPSVGVLSWGGTPAFAGQTISVASIPTLTFALASNNGTTTTDFNFQVQDTGGTANGGINTDPTENTITFALIDFNLPPNGADKAVVFNEDTPYVFKQSDFGFSDTDDNNFVAVKINSLPSSGTLTFVGIPVFPSQIILSSLLSILKYTPAAEVNGTGVASIDFQVIDDGGTANGGINTDQTDNTITFDINSVNDAPSGTDASITVNEYSSYRFSAADFGFSDLETDGFSALTINTLPTTGTLQMSGVPVTAGQSFASASIPSLTFNLSSNNGNSNTSLDFQVKDTGGTANNGIDTDPTQNTITINMPNVDVAPEGTDSTIIVDEDTPYPFSQSAFGFGDIDGNNFSAVKINTLPTSGTLTLAGSPVDSAQTIPSSQISNLLYTPAADVNGSGIASIDFQVIDDGDTANNGVNTDQTDNTINFDINAVNDAPTGTNALIAANEYSSYQFLASDFGFSDPDNNGFATVTINTLPTTGTLLLDGSSVIAGQSVSYASIPLLTFDLASNNGNSNTSFDFQLKDNGGTANNGIDKDPTPNTITINMANVNVAPEGTDKTIVTNEDTAYFFSQFDFGYSDIDGNSFAAVQINSTPSSGTLTLAGIPITNTQIIPSSQINNLKYTPAPDANGAGIESIKFQVVDDGGTANNGVSIDQTDNSITFDIIAVNDAPSASDRTVSVNEYSSYYFTATDFAYSDTESDSLTSVTITSLPTVGSLLFNGNTVAENDTINATQISNLQYQLGSSGGLTNTAFKFLVQDAGGITNGGTDTDQTENTITLNVLQVNLPPNGSDRTIEVTEDSDYAFKVSDFGFTDSDGDTLAAVEIASLPTIGSLQLQGIPVVSGQSVLVNDISDLVFTPAPNNNSSVNFDFKVQDNGTSNNGGANTDPTTATINIDIVAVNDPPSGVDATISTAEDNDYTFDIQDFGYTDIENDGFLGVTIETLPSGGTLLFANTPVNAGELLLAFDIGAGAFTFSPHPNSNGQSNFDFTVIDAGGTQNNGENSDPTSNKIIINITAVSDAPTGTNGSVNLTEDNSHTFRVSDFGFSDPADNDQFIGLTLGEIPASGLIELSEQAVQPGDFVSRTQIDLGQLKYKPDANDNSSGNRLGFLVTDNGNTLTGVNTDNTERFITLNIIGVNDMPILTTNNSSVLVGQTVVITIADLFATDIEDSASDLIFTINENTNRGALSNNGVTLSSGDSFTLADVINSSLRYSHDGSQSSIDTVTLELIDSAGASTQGVLQFNIVDIIDAAPATEPDIVEAISSGESFSEIPTELNLIDYTSDELLSETSTDTIATANLAVEEITTQDVKVDISQEGIIGDSQRGARLDANNISDESSSSTSLLNVEANQPFDPYTGVGKFASEDYFRDIPVKQHRHLETLQLLEYNEESNLSAFTIDITIPSIESMRISENPSFQRGLDMVNETLDSPGDERQRRFAVANDAAVGASISVTAGALAWMLRGGSIVAAMVSTTPLWGSIDPLRVVSSSEKERANDDSAVERMFDEDE